jgi:hypothetical protein
MIRKGVQRFSEKIMLKTINQSAMTVRPNLIALWRGFSERGFVDAGRTRPYSMDIPGEADPAAGPL